MKENVAQWNAVMDPNGMTGHLDIILGATECIVIFPVCRFSRAAEAGCLDKVKLSLELCLELGRYKKDQYGYLKERKILKQ